MLIDFNKIHETVILHFRGGESETRARTYVDPDNKIMQGRLRPGASIGMHTHKTNSEIIYILEGQGKILYDDVCEEAEAGVCHYCPKGHAHSLINDSDEELVFLAVIPEHPEHPEERNN